MTVGKDGWGEKVAKVFIGRRRWTYSPFYALRCGVVPQLMIALADTSEMTFS